MARGYEAQRIAKRVRSSAPAIEPEMAEFESRVFSLAFTLDGTPGRLEFPVLALDAANAEAIGRLRVGAHGAAAVLLSAASREIEYSDFALMACESEAERECRRAAYRARVASC